MTAYYADFVNGLDTNNGLGPDASHATNKPWKTVSKALGASGISSGDTLYLAPGSFRATQSVAMTSPTAETKVLGDPQNAQGFKTAAGVKVVPGEVVITCYTTNDSTAPSFSNLLNLSGRDYLTFQYLTFVTGAHAIVSSTPATPSQHITIRDCNFIAVTSSIVLAFYTGFGVPLDLLVERCVFLTSSSQPAPALDIQGDTAAAGADYDLGVTVRNCLFLGSTLLKCNGAGGLAFKPGGIQVIGCTAWGCGNQPMFRLLVDMSTTIPCRVYGCILASSSSTCMSATTLGTLIEDYNWIAAATARTNVAVGSNSKVDSALAPLFHVGEERRRGAPMRMFLEPWPGWGGRRLGHDAAYTTSDDLLGRSRPPTTALRTWGAVERGNIAARETSVAQASGNAICLVGPGTQEFQVPVDAASTTLSIHLRYDSTYGGSQPQFKLLANPEIGVAEQTVACTAAALNAWEKVSLAAFTPAAAGIVTVRVISNDTGATGKTYADTFEIA